MNELFTIPGVAISRFFCCKLAFAGKGAFSVRTELGISRRSQQNAVLPKTADARSLINRMVTVLKHRWCQWFQPPCTKYSYLILQWRPIIHRLLSGDHFLYGGETLCTTETTFCTTEIFVLQRSLSVLGREFVYYRDHFLYWGETFCTTEITLCTGRDFEYYRDHFLYWGETFCTMEITFCTEVRLFVRRR